MSGESSHRRNARCLKALALLYLALVGASFLLVYGDAYEPAVHLLLFLAACSVGVTASVAVVLLPAEQFSWGFSGGVYALLAASTAMMTFFSGGTSSELYLLFFPLLLAAALHGSWRVALWAFVSVLLFYALAVLPGLLNEEADASVAAPVLYRLGILGLTGVFVAVVYRLSAGGGEEEDSIVSDEDGSLLLERVEREISARRGVQVAVILVDPGRGVEDVEALLERVRARIAEPVLLGEGTVFGLVLSGVGDREIESAARRALAAAGSLGARETRAGVAVYPRDARSAEDLLVAAGRALEAAFEVDSPSAIVLAGRRVTREEERRAAR
ncbi:hypothetical protein RxyAA322_27190 [Rubrobacter xylanophilus]|uniref:GGDEF domain-containing protein n=1 Tax=Rubrobacter xylanophilus TaxID=49319 RepID=A0A510HN94_9ACTN|nr:hypothetical protein [Rubrobacter xylanophilus]BBL80865.1 hypothetical protein RxyAA322_27190 [Rubrobacter xylanophilus]